MDKLKMIFDTLLNSNQPSWGIPGWASVLGFIWAVSSSIYGGIQQRKASKQRKLNKSLPHTIRHAMTAKELCTSYRNISRKIESKKFASAKEDMGRLRDTYIWLKVNRHHDIWGGEEQWVSLSTRVTDVTGKINDFSRTTSQLEIKNSRDAIESIAGDLGNISAEYEKHVGKSL